MKTFYRNRVRAAHVLKYLSHHGPCTVQHLAAVLKEHRHDALCEIPGCEVIEWWSVYDSIIYANLRRLEKLGIVTRERAADQIAFKWEAVPGKHYFEPLIRPEAVEIADVRDALLTIRARLDGVAQPA